MNKFTIPALICALLISNKAYTQETNNTEIRDYLDRMFEKTQLKRVPTGFLLDYAVDLVDFDNYNGRFITDSNCVSISTFEIGRASCRERV